MRDNGDDDGDAKVRGKVVAGREGGFGVCGVLHGCVWLRVRVRVCDCVCVLLRL